MTRRARLGWSVAAVLLVAVVLALVLHGSAGLGPGSAPPAVPENSSADAPGRAGPTGMASAPGRASAGESGTAASGKLLVKQLLEVIQPTRDRYVTEEDCAQAIEIARSLEPDHVPAFIEFIRDRDSRLDTDVLVDPRVSALSRLFYSVVQYSSLSEYVEENCQTHVASGEPTPIRDGRVKQLMLDLLLDQGETAKIRGWALYFLEANAADPEVRQAILDLLRQSPDAPGRMFWLVVEEIPTSGADWLECGIFEDPLFAQDACDAVWARLLEAPELRPRSDTGELVPNYYRRLAVTFIAKARVPGYEDRLLELAREASDWRMAGCYERAIRGFRTPENQSRILPYFEAVLAESPNRSLFEWRLKDLAYWSVNRDMTPEEVVAGIRGVWNRFRDHPWAMDAHLTWLEEAALEAVRGEIRIGPDLYLLENMDFNPRWIRAKDTMRVWAAEDLSDPRTPDWARPVLERWVARP